MNNDSFLNCAPGNANNLELICVNNTMINYLENTTILLVEKHFSDLVLLNLVFTTNSSYYGVS